MRSKPPLTRRIESCASRSPSSEITTVSTERAISAACCSISNPVVTSVMRMPSSCSSRQSAHRLRCSSGSPPVSITRCTCSARMDSTWRSSSSNDDLALVGVRLPDVAHHAAAIAGAVHAQREDRQALEPMRHPAAGAARDLAGTDHQCSTSNPGSCSRIFATWRPIQRGDDSRRSVEHRRHRIDAAGREHVRQRRLGHHRLSANHRHSHVTASGVDERVERTRSRSAASTIRSAGTPTSMRPPPSRRSSWAAPAPTVRARPSALSCRVSCADRSSSSRSRSPLSRESLPSASRSASSNARTSAVSVEQELVRRRAPDESGAGADHAIRGGPTERHAVDEHGVRAPGSRARRARPAPPAPLRRGPRPHESSTASRTACGDATRATASPSMCSEWLKPKRSTTRTGKRRRSTRCIGL